MIRIDFEINFKPWNITMAENSEEADLNDLIRRLEALSPEKRDRVLKNSNPPSPSPPQSQQQVGFLRFEINLFYGSAIDCI